jgi:hypothetical protein
MHVGVVIDDLLAELGGEHFFCQSHADGGGDALAERAGRRFDALVMKFSGWPGVFEPSWRKP